MMKPVLLAIVLAGGPSASILNASDDADPCGPVINAPHDETQVRWMTSLPVVLTTPPTQLRGHRLSLQDVIVQQVDVRGFWIGGGGDACRLYVAPAEGPLIRVTPGERVDLQGEFRFRAQAGGRQGARTGVYVYAYIVREAPEDRREHR